MPDIFDRLASDASAPGDIFDRLARDAKPPTPSPPGEKAPKLSPGQTAMRAELPSDTAGPDGFFGGAVQGQKTGAAGLLREAAAIIRGSKQISETVLHGVGQGPVLSLLGKIAPDALDKLAERIAPAFPESLPPQTASAKVGAFLGKVPADVLTMGPAMLAGLAGPEASAAVFGAQAFLKAYGETGDVSKALDEAGKAAFTMAAMHRAGQIGTGEMAAETALGKAAGGGLRAATAGGAMAATLPENATPEEKASAFVSGAAFQGVPELAKAGAEAFARARVRPAETGRAAQAATEDWLARIDAARQEPPRHPAESPAPDLLRSARPTREMTPEERAALGKAAAKDFGEYARLRIAADKAGLGGLGDIFDLLVAQKEAQAQADAEAAARNPATAPALAKALDLASEPTAKDLARYAHMRTPEGLRPPEGFLLDSPPPERGGAPSPPPEGQSSVPPAAPPEPAPPPPVPPVAERRSALDLRAAVESAGLTPQQIHDRLFVDQRSGVRTRAAYDLLDEQGGLGGLSHAYFDGEGIKAINDAHGHDAGDQVIDAIARTVREVYGDSHAYRANPSGDEFMGLHGDPAQAVALAQEVQRRLAGTRLEVDTPTGKKYIAGIGVRYGTGGTRAEADAAANAARANGPLRTPAGGEHPGVPETGAGAGQGRPDHPASPALTEVTPPPAQGGEPAKAPAVEPDLIGGHPTTLVPWESAKPGDVVGPNGETLIRRRIQTKRAAMALAAKRDGSVVMDGFRTWAVTTKGKPPSRLDQAKADWREGRAYVDGNGNYHLRPNGRTQGNGPIAPWNKEAKAAFPDSKALHEAATERPGGTESPAAGSVPAPGLQEGAPPAKEPAPLVHGSEPVTANEAAQRIAAGGAFSPMPPAAFQAKLAELTGLRDSIAKAEARAKGKPPTSPQTRLARGKAQELRNEYEASLAEVAGEHGEAVAASLRDLAEGKATEMHGGLGAVAGAGKAAFSLLEAAHAKRVPVLGEVAPAAAKVLSGAADVKEDIQKTFGPQTISQPAAVAANVIRYRNGERARRMEQATVALRETAKALRKVPASVYAPEETRPLVETHGFTEAQAAQLAFIQRMETGKAQPTPELDNAAKALRSLLDSTWGKVQAAKGTESFLRNYFPHVWAQPEDASAAIGRIMGKRPLQGPASFFKHRTIPTTADGLEAGLRPVSTDPVELTLLKVHEMNRFLMGDAIVKDLKARRLMKYFRAGTAPDPSEGLAPVNDKVGTVYGPPEIRLKEAYDEQVYGKLEALAASLGISHERLQSLGAANRWGEADTTGKNVKTRFAGPESVLAHEIGHAIDFKYKLWDTLVTGAEGVGARGEVTKAASQAQRGTIQKELRALADLYWEGQEPPSRYHQNYLHKRTEQIAHIIEAYIHAPDKLREAAPTVAASFEKFLADHPEVAPLRDIKPSLVLGTRGQAVPVPGIRIMGRWYVPAEVGHVLDTFLSPGLSGNALYDAWRGIGNTLNQASLGISGFHLLFTANDAAVSRTALGIEQAIQGKPLEAAKAIASTPAAPVTNILKGQNLYKAYQAGEVTDPRLAQMVDALVQSGGRVRMDSFYKNDNVTKFFQALKENRYAAAAFRALPAGIETLAKPIMEWIVPRQKLGVFSDLAANELARLGPNAGEDATRAALAKVWDSVDNRMGQLVYDNLFWNKAAKDLGMASVRSLGWNLGTIRELGGAVADTARAVSGKAEAGQPKFTHRMAYAVALPIVTGLQGAILTYLFTGHGPQALKDYWLIPTGRKNPDGSDERIVLPSYMKDVLAAGVGFDRGTRTGLAGLATMAGHKLHPLASAVMDMLRNEDFYGTEIAHPGDTMGQQALDELAYLGKQAVPFSMRGYQQRRAAGETATKAAGAFLGINPAPAYLTRSPAQKQISDYMAQNMPQGARTKEEAAQGDARRALVNDLRLDNPGARDNLVEAVRSGDLTITQAKALMKKAGQDPMVYSFTRLHMDQAQHVMNLATPSEKQRLALAYLMKWVRLFKTDPRKAVQYRDHVLAVRDASLAQPKPSPEGAVQ